MEIRSHRGTYKVSLVEDYLQTLENVAHPGDCLVIDSRVLELYPEISRLDAGLRRVVVESHERAKSYAAIGQVMRNLVEQGFKRNNSLIAIGGGITQDVTAFSASVLFRGVPWYFFPTNLLTQCDSCIGSKTSVNLGEYKNQLGSFFPPSQVFIDVAFLNTLPNSEIRSGLGEMLHFFLVDGEESLRTAEGQFPQVLADRSLLKTLILHSLKIKKALVEIDEFDQGPRNVFNYGHSFGHALETTTGFAVPHGTAVGFGMDLANIISADRGLISMAFRNRIRRVLDVVISETNPGGFEVDTYFDALRKDKKNEGAEINVILTRGVGKMFKSPLRLDDTLRERVRSFFRSCLWKSDM